MTAVAAPAKVLAATDPPTSDLPDPTNRPENELPTADGHGSADASETPLYLEVYFGDKSSGRIAYMRMRNHRLYTTPNELRELGVVVGPDAAVDDTGNLALDSLPGLTYRYEAVDQRLVLIVPPALRPQQLLGYRPPVPMHATRGHGLLLNYDAYARGGNGGTTLALGTELRWFGRLGALEVVGVSRAGGDSTAYERLDTRWTYSDPIRLTTWAAGDVITGGLAWTRPVRLGGLQWRRNFDLRPNLITFPMPRFSSSAAVPSAVEVYVDNLQQFSGQVDDGPFVLDTLPRINGAGQVSLVVRDALGRVTRTTVPLYVDQQRLAPGLTDFSFELGVLREGYGDQSNDYGRDWVGSGSWQRGMTDTFTVQAHAEAGPGLRQAGLGGIWAPGNYWGLVTASYARSHGDRNGHQYTVGYQWNNRRFSVNAQTQRRSAEYGQLGDLIDDASAAPVITAGGPTTASAAATTVTPTTASNVVRTQDSASFSVPVARNASLAYTWLRLHRDDGSKDRVDSLSFSQVLRSQLSISASAFDSNSSGRGASVSLSFPLGRTRYVNLSFDHSQNGLQAVADLRQSSEDSRRGWDLQIGDRNGAYAHASMDLHGPRGEAWFGAEYVQDRTNYFFQGSGSLIRMDGQYFIGARVHDAFALVSTNGVADVPILHENRLFGRTNEKGYLMLSGLLSWQRNLISIDPDDMGANYRLPDLEQETVPADNGAVLMRFPISLVHPALVKLQGPTGAPVAAGSRGKVLDGQETFIVGFDGEAYIENRRADTTLELEVSGTVCTYRLPAPDPAPVSGTPKVGPLPCEQRRTP